MKASRRPQRPGCIRPFINRFRRWLHKSPKFWLFNSLKFWVLNNPKFSVLNRPKRWLLNSPKFSVLKSPKRWLLNSSKRRVYKCLLKWVLIFIGVILGLIIIDEILPQTALQIFASYSDEKNLIVLPKHTLPNSHAIYNGLEYRKNCFDDCSLKRDCVSLVYMDALSWWRSSCWHYNGTPYTLGLPSVPNSNFSIHIKRTEVEGTFTYSRDNMYYYASRKTYSLTDASIFCKNLSESFHLAITSPQTNILEYIMKLLRTATGRLGEDIRPGFYIHEIDLSPEAKVKKNGSTAVRGGKIRSSYMACYKIHGNATCEAVASVQNRTIPRLALCQADPFNLMNHHNLTKRVTSMERLNRQQAIEKFLLGTGDELHYMID